MLAISLRHLETFVTIAAAGTVKAAAEQLFVTQPATSMALAELERQLDAPLFERLRGRMQLSAKGKELLPQAQEILERMYALQRSALPTGPIKGELNLGTSNTVGNYLIGDLLGDFVRQHPDVQLHVDVSNTQTIAKQMLDHRLHVACVEGPIQHPDLESRVWRSDCLQVVAAPNHPLAQKENLEAMDFAGVAWITREAGSASRALTELALRDIPMGNVLLELGQVEAIKQAAIAGMGLACLPQAATVDAISAGRLKTLATPFLALERKIWLVLHKARYRGAALDAFLALHNWPSLVA